ncbi:Imm21 family immunity protein [Streptomyces sp. NBC_01236]|uniref:Imm21 family immunity protein n=1 Tax=Streptomyces sp. NBC_01236 TaxID=2903789 RepID=UPI002E10BD28|nr:immunity 21 family protein [Streptomyces sp. NBC_01236]
MSISSPHASGSAGRQLAWVESMGGPLVVVPVSALARWGGCTMNGMVIGDTDTPDDYDRACEVDGLAGVIAMSEGSMPGALVLADQPAPSCYLPERRTFLRWSAAHSESDLLAAAEAVLADPATHGDLGRRPVRRRSLGYARSPRLVLGAPRLSRTAQTLTPKSWAMPTRPDA